MTDGCVHLLFNSSWKFYQLAAGQLLSGQPERYGKDRRYGPSIMYKITPAGSLSSSQQGGPPCWTSPLAFGLFVSDHNFVFIFAYKLLRFFRGKVYISIRTKGRRINPHANSVSIFFVYSSMNHACFVQKSAMIELNTKNLFFFSFYEWQSIFT